MIFFASLRLWDCSHSVFHWPHYLKNRPLLSSYISIAYPLADLLHFLILQFPSGGQHSWHTLIHRIRFSTALLPCFLHGLVASAGPSCSPLCWPYSLRSCSTAAHVF